MDAGRSEDLLDPEHARALLASLAVGVVSRDRERRVVYLNPAAGALLGRAPDGSGAGEPCEALLGHVDHSGTPLCGRSCPAERCLAGEAVPELRLWLRPAGGGLVAVLSRFAPRRNQAGEIVGTVETLVSLDGSSAGPAAAQGLWIDLGRRQVRRDGTIVRLTRTEFDLLACLARQRERAVRHQELLEAVWGPGCEGQTQYLHTFISQLRRKLEADPRRPRYIRTEPHYGYRLHLAPGEVRYDGATAAARPGGEGPSR